MVGMIEASATRRPETPRTRQPESTTDMASVPIFAVAGRVIHRLAGAAHDVQQLGLRLHP